MGGDGEGTRGLSDRGEGCAGELPGDLPRRAPLAWAVVGRPPPARGPGALDRSRGTSERRRESRGGRLGAKPRGSRRLALLQTNRRGTRAAGRELGAGQQPREPGGAHAASTELQGPGDPHSEISEGTAVKGRLRRGGLIGEQSGCGKIGDW